MPYSIVFLEDRVSRLSARVGFLFWLIALSACISPDGIGPQMEVAEQLIVELQLTEADEPKQVESKTVRYVSTTGLAAGDVESVVESTEERLQKAGWSVMKMETLDTSDSPAQQGARVVATKDSLMAQAAIFDQIGVNPAPEGFTWVQIQVANVNDDLGWIEDS